MKQRNWKRLLCLSLLAVLLLSAVTMIPRTAKGFGDFDSHSDYGGSRSSSDSDSDGIDLYSLLRIATFLGRLLGIESPVVSILLVVVLFAVIKFGIPALKKRSGHSSGHEGIRRGVREAPDSLQQLAADDPAFSAEDLIQRVKDLYRRMQACWEDGNIEPLRKDFMPDTWTRFNTQLQNKNISGETTHVRNIGFQQVSLLDYSTDSEHQVLRVKIDVAQNIWATGRDGKGVRGTEDTRKRFEYLWTLVRPLGSVTGGAAPADEEHCPNCGAEIDLEAFAECPFCHTPFMKVSPDWVIHEIDALSQQTLHE